MLHLVTVATHSERYLPILEKQAEDNGLKLVKLGMGKKYVGHYMKDLEMMEYLKTIDKNDVVIFVDGFDSLMLAHKDEILKKFENSGAELLLSVENIGFLSFIHATVFERVKGCYLNTGLYMGRAGFLLKFLEDMYNQVYDKKSNQKTWCSYLFNLDRQGKFDGIKLDKNSDIFLNHSFTTNNKPKFKDKRIEIKDGSKPCFIQGNGCEDMTYIINGTGYKSYNIHKNSFWKNKMEYNMRAVFKVYNPILTFYIYLIIVLIFLVSYFSYKYYKYRKLDYFYLSTL
jgi:hypothetical protein